jgi:hypothetical protein
VTGRRARRRRKLLDDLKERREYSHLKEEALDRTMRRPRFGRGLGPVVRQTTKWMNEWDHEFLTRGPPGCITGPAANFIISVRTIAITQELWRLGLPLTVIFPSVASETAHNNRCGHLPYTFGGSWYWQRLTNIRPADSVRPSLAWIFSLIQFNRHNTVGLQKIIRQMY